MADLLQKVCPTTFLILTIEIGDSKHYEISRTDLRTWPELNRQPLVPQTNALSS